VLSALAVFDLDEAGREALIGNPHDYLSSLPAAEGQSLRAALTPAYKQGFRVIFLVGATLAALAFVLAYFLMPQVALDRDDDSKLKEQAREASNGSEKIEGQ
jgi:hypothetical protein